MPTLRPGLECDDREHDCESCLWHYDDVWHTEHCPTCRHAPEDIASSGVRYKNACSGNAVMIIDHGPRPDNWWPKGGRA